jgi:DNA polymerase III epsilon subunit-like protein
MDHKTIDTILIIDIEGNGKFVNEICGVLFHIPTQTTKAIVVVIIPHGYHQYITTACRDETWKGLPNFTKMTSKMAELVQLFHGCDAVVSHNSSFDHGIITKIDELKILCTKPWICTVNDVKWEDYGGYPKRPSLEDLCQTYGVPYVFQHHAQYDCEMLKNCLKKAGNMHERINLACKDKMTKLATQKEKLEAQNDKNNKRDDSPRSPILPPPTDSMETVEAVEPIDPYQAQRLQSTVNEIQELEMKLKQTENQYTQMVETLKEQKQAMTKMKLQKARLVQRLKNLKSTAEAISSYYHLPIPSPMPNLEMDLNGLPECHKCGVPCGKNL